MCVSLSKQSAIKFVAFKGQNGLLDFIGSKYFDLLRHMITAANQQGMNVFEISPVFDLEHSKTIIEPTGQEKGYWAGACGAAYDPETKTYYLSYRVREPRPVRGGICRIAESKDGENFKTIWSATKESLNSDSIEKSSLIKGPEGLWWMYISYVDPIDKRWKIDLMKAAHPSEFQINERKEVLKAAQTGTEGVKDPFAFFLNGKMHLLVSYATGLHSANESQKEAMHATGDIYNTGLTKSCSGLAVSDDGENFEWLGNIFAPSDNGWDKYASRINSFIYRAPFFLGFYDGSSKVEENYEERTGLAVSLDLLHWKRLTPSGPHIESPHLTGSIRYIYPIDLGSEVVIYYEYTRADGAHEIRMNRIHQI